VLHTQRRVALALASRGVPSDLRLVIDPATSQEIIYLAVAGEKLQVCQLSDVMVLITESGRVIGFADDPGIIKQLCDLASSSEPSAPDAAARGLTRGCRIREGGPPRPGLVLGDRTAS
jgi:hypothetical protein